MTGLRFVTSIILSAALFASTSPAGEDGEFAYFVGKAACLQCHDGRAAGERHAGPCSLEPIPAHDTTLALLDRDAAASIAALSGIGEPPRESRICLACHATAADEGPRWTTETFRLDDGVQCEHCHGPGSLHVPYRQHENQADQRAAERARLRRGSRDDCAHCHIDRPSHREVVERGFRLAPADRRYKTPVNLAVSDDGARLFVACEHGNSLIVISTESASVACEVGVGRAPHALAIGPGGRRVYVSNRLSGTVSVVDAGLCRAVGEVSVGAEPHGLWVDPDGSGLLVANTGNNSLSIVDTDELSETRRLVMGNGPWDVAVDEQGAYAYVTNVRPQEAKFREPRDSEVSVVDVAAGRVAARLNVADANMLQGVAWIPGTEMGLVTLMRTKNLIPISRLRQGWVITNGLGVIRRDGTVTQVLLDEPNRFFPDPMDVAVSPDGRFALVTSGGCDAVALVDVSKLLKIVAGSTQRERDQVIPNHLGYARRFVVKRLDVGANPRGVAFAPDGRVAYVANALDDSISVIDTEGYRVAATIALGDPVKVTEIRRGERLFHHADITYARQFSCHSCHPDGHINGLTHDIEADGIGLHPVDNRTLRGIFDTPPFKWEGTNASLSRQCGARLAVFFTRLDPFDDDELRALVRYMCTIKLAPNPYREEVGLTPAQRRGKLIFDRTTFEDGTPIPSRDRCITCHANALFTDRRAVSVGTAMWYDEFVGTEPIDIFDTDEYGTLGTYYFVDPSLEQRKLDVPHLRNIFNSPPYLHNGASPTLEEIWTRFNIIGLHGTTGSLTRPQYNDLIAYLKSL